MTKTVLVTGAAGFIGSHVAQQLLERGDRVVGLDNFNDYYSPARKRANIDEVREASPGNKLVFVEGDIRDASLLESLYATHGFDTVVHLAAMAGVRASVDNPFLYYDVNVAGTMALLEAGRKHGLPTFICASTSSVYGNTDVIPFQETDPCDRPLAPYAAAKRAAEMLAYTWHHLYGQNVTVLRFFTVYGPRGRPDMMTYKVFESVVSRREVPLFNRGQMYRDWTYVGDIAAGVVAAVDRPLGYEVINLGRGEPVLLADFVQAIEELTGKQAHLRPAPMPDTDIPYTFADISRARRLLDYDPQISVKQGVEGFWNWYKGSVLEQV